MVYSVIQHLVHINLAGKLRKRLILHVIKFADLIGADSREIVFTSGATEADNLAIKGAAHFYQTKVNTLLLVKLSTRQYWILAVN